MFYVKGHMKSYLIVSWYAHNPYRNIKYLNWASIKCLIMYCSLLHVPPLALCWCHHNGGSMLINIPSPI